MPSGSFGKVCVYLLPQKRAVGAVKIGGVCKKEVVRVPVTGDPMHIVRVWTLQ